MKQYLKIFCYVRAWERSYSTFCFRCAYYFIKYTIEYYFTVEGCNLVCTYMYVHTVGQYLLLYQTLVMQSSGMRFRTTVLKLGYYWLLVSPSCFATLSCTVWVEARDNWAGNPTYTWNLVLALSTKDYLISAIRYPGIPCTVSRSTFKIVRSWQELCWKLEQGRRMSDTRYSTEKQFWLQSRSATTSLISLRELAIVA